MLEHLREWLKLRSISQREVAAALSVSEATVSAWIAGKQRMSVGQLRQIAVLLQASPGDLLEPPNTLKLSEKVENTLSLMAQLDDAEWDAVMANARMIAAAKRRA